MEQENQAVVEAAEAEEGAEVNTVDLPEVSAILVEMAEEVAVAEVLASLEAEAAEGEQENQVVEVVAAVEVLASLVEEWDNLAVEAQVVEVEMEVKQ